MARRSTPTSSCGGYGIRSERPALDSVHRARRTAGRAGGALVAPEPPEGARRRSGRTRSSARCVGGSAPCWCEGRKCSPRQRASCPSEPHQLPSLLSDPRHPALKSSRTMESGRAEVTTTRTGKCRMSVGTARLGAAPSSPRHQHRNTLFGRPLKPPVYARRSASSFSTCCSNVETWPKSQPA